MPVRCSEGRQGTQGVGCQLMGGMMVRDQTQRGRCAAVLIINDNGNVGGPAAVAPVR